MVTFALDDLDWEDEIRVFLEERASFSPDALTGLEANLRFGGPETMETKIFARLSRLAELDFSAPQRDRRGGALCRYGSGRKPEFDDPGVTARLTCGGHDRSGIWISRMSIIRAGFPTMSA